ncbi:TonB-dependent receptor [Sphingomonas piscis]|uniref:TonB-dependent receptor n=1 Tax=Sphingomonas piscis TaxID=2714943 RepID=A0A6G7YLV0_9SPHN|nr:TonB-dependent receptor [Sphingomonas piscis]QIK77725.1 TonB-dependent receptor [Sphingomonas piscis]
MKPILRAGGACLLITAVPVSSASAQDRTDDNAITQAEDAFGFSVGREAIGIYGPGQARGFSPTAAGNVRIEGLYFDPAFNLQNLLVDSVSIKVGLSAQGYPFVAPSGIVDQRLRRPDSTPGASLLINGDGWGGKGVEVDGSIPITGTLGLRAGANAGRTVYPNGTDGFSHSESLLLRWKPSDKLEVMPFWAMFNDYDDEAGTFYVPAGDYLGIPDRAGHDESPKWADIRFRTTNMGLLGNLSLAKDTVLRLGVFRSSVFNKHLYNHLLVDQQPDGSGERILIADPQTRNRSLSGELRLTHSILDGPRLHLFNLSLRKRDARREFGGSDVVSYGLGALGERVTAPKPDFEFGELTRQRLRQTTYGAAYNGRWKDVGEISFGLSRARYRKVTRIPDEATADARSRPWLYNGTAAVILSPSVSVYAGFAKGLEESGVAPQNAANRNEPLPTILTKQKDAGVRFALTKGVKAVVGVFDLRRPYFGYDEANLFGQVGSIRSRGAEFSISGSVVKNVNLVFGGVLLRPRVEKNADAVGEIGDKPFGLPTHILNANVNWAVPFLKGLQLDAGIFRRGRQPQTVSNRVYLPARTTMTAGGRYGLKLARKDASLRVQVRNLFDNNDALGAGPGLYAPRDHRQVTGALTVDF